MSDTRREHVESPTFGKGWLIWPGLTDGMRFTFESDTGEESTWTQRVRFTMDVERGVLTTDSPRRHRDIDRAEAKGDAVEEYARYEQEIDEDTGVEPFLDTFTRSYFLDEVPADPDGEQWFTLVTGDGEVFGFRRLRRVSA